MHLQEILHLQLQNGMLTHLNMHPPVLPATKFSQIANSPLVARRIVQNKAIDAAGAGADAAGGGGGGAAGGAAGGGGGGRSKTMMMHGHVGASSLALTSKHGGSHINIGRNKQRVTMGMGMVMQGAQKGQGHGRKLSLMNAASYQIDKQRDAAGSQAQRQHQEWLGLLHTGDYHGRYRQAVLKPPFNANS